MLDPYFAEPPVCLTATANVACPLPEPQQCPYCAGPVALVANAAVYGSNYGDWPYAYLCRPCDAYVGLHKGTLLPEGTLAKEDLRAKRRQARDAFKALLARDGLTEEEGLREVSIRTGMTVDECRIDMLTLSSCAALLLACTVGSYEDFM